MDYTCSKGHKLILLAINILCKWSKCPHFFTGQSNSQTDKIECLTRFAYACMCWVGGGRGLQNANSKRIDNSMCKGPFVFISDKGQNMLKHCDILLLYKTNIQIVPIAIRSLLET